MKPIFVKCPCGQCDDWHIQNFGKFVQGSGFSSKEKELLEKLFDEVPRQAFELGFFCSSEGFNGEYPFYGELEDDTRGRKWHEMRDRELAATFPQLFGESK